MTLTNGSVPDARNNTRPLSDKRASAAFTAAAITAAVKSAEAR